MIKPETIRKGSKVFFSDTRDGPVTVLNNENGKITVRLDDLIETTAEKLFPIPLTPELILRCGFFKTDEFVFEHPVEGIELDYDHKGITHMHVRSKNKTIRLTALHEFQNAYWLYTDKELMFV